MCDNRSDYPAAHSMDTDWFAVDADGHVGVFESGEGGAVPKGFRWQESAAWNLVRRLATEAPEAVWRGGAARGCHCREKPVAHDIGLYAVILFLRPGTAWPTLEDDWSNPVWSDAFDTADGPVCAVYCEAMDDAAYDRLHEAGGCLGCGCQDGGRMSHLGLFEFDNDSYGLSPYTRTGAPQTPLRLDDLPPDLQRLIERCHLPAASFGRDNLLQPLEHRPCATWGGDSYGSSDGHSRVPLPPPKPDKEFFGR
jgi:hypothetical protein